MTPVDDKSKARWTLAKCLWREYGDAFSVLDFAAILEEGNERTEGGFGDFVGDGAKETGNYDFREIARVWLRSKNDNHVSDTESFGEVSDEEGKAKAEQEKKSAQVVVKSFLTFKSEYRPAQYVLDGIAQRGALYTWTAKTGAGKTSLLSSATLAIAAKRDDILGLEVEHGVVAYCTFENPDDFRVKLLAAQYAHGVADEVVAERVKIIDARHPISKIKKALTQEGELTAIIIDTLQAAFDGDDSNANQQTLDFMKRVRGLTELPGRPGVFVAAHPIKGAQKDNLIPYGGGAMLNEVDGNLTLWKDATTGNIEMHHQGKFRGLEFDPKFFRLELVSCEDLLDAKGRPLLLPVTKASNADAVAQREETAGRDKASKDAALLAALIATPDGSQAALALRCGCDRSTVSRSLKRLQGEKLVKDVGGSWRVTARGAELVDEVRRRAEMAGQTYEAVEDADE